MLNGDRNLTLTRIHSGSFEPVLEETPKLAFILPSTGLTSFRENPAKASAAPGHPSGFSPPAWKAQPPWAFSKNPVRWVSGDLSATDTLPVMGAVNPQLCLLYFRWSGISVFLQDLC